VQATISSVTSTAISTSVPTDATTGPITVTTSFGTGTSTGSFVVIPTPDFQVTASGDARRAGRRSASFQIGLTGSGGFTCRAGGVGVPAGATGLFGSPTLTAGQRTGLTLTTTGTTPAGSYALTVTATGMLNGVSTTRSAGVMVQVLGAGVTSLAGQVLDEEAEAREGRSGDDWARCRRRPRRPPPTTAATSCSRESAVGVDQLLFIDGGPASTPEQEPSDHSLQGDDRVGPGRYAGLHAVPALQKTTGMVDISNNSVERVVTDPEIPGSR
jgi:hypothetical protein